MKGSVLPFFNLADEAGNRFDSREMLGLRWLLASVPGHDPDALMLLETKHARLMMMNAPLIIVTRLAGQALVNLRGLGSGRLKVISDPDAIVIDAMGGSRLAVIGREHEVIASYDGLETSTLDRAVRRLSRP